MRSSEGLDTRRRRALYRAWHRGTREMDLIMGRFADREIDRFDEAELAVFEALIEAPDGELFAWMLEREPVPAVYDTPVLRRLMQFNASGEAARS